VSRGYNQNKRARENEKAKKKREKAMRRRMKREEGPSELDVVDREELIATTSPSVEELMEQMEAPRNGGGGTAIPARLFVGGLSYDTTAQTLKSAFEEFGEVADAVVVTDRSTGNSRGFGFVTMANRRDAPKAIDGLTDSELDGRRIFVNTATER